MQEKRREHEIEVIVRKKIELERIADRKRDMNREFEKLSLMYEVIQEGKYNV